MNGRLETSGAAQSTRLDVSVGLQCMSESWISRLYCQWRNRLVISNKHAKNKLLSSQFLIETASRCGSGYRWIFSLQKIQIKNSSPFKLWEKKFPTGVPTCLGWQPRTGTTVTIAKDKFGKRILKTFLFQGVFTYIKWTRLLPPQPWYEN